MKKAFIYLWLSVFVLNFLIAIAPKGIDGILFKNIPLILISFLIIPFLVGMLLILIQNKKRAHEFMPIFLLGAFLNNFTAVLVVSLIEFSRQGYFLGNQLYRPSFSLVNIFTLFLPLFLISFFGALIGLVIRGSVLLINKQYEKK